MILKELRKEKGISQPELANYLGVSVATISRYENGDREPDMQTLVKLADYFHITVDELLGHKPSTHRLALSLDGDLTDSQIEEINQFINFIKNRKN